MLVKPISAIPANDSDNVEWLETLVTKILPVGEVAVALHASDLPTKRADFTQAELIAFAVQGLARTGVEAARAMDVASRAAVLQEHELYDLGIPMSDPQRRQVARIADAPWGSYRRKQRCVDVAYDVTGFYDKFPVIRPRRTATASSAATA